MKLKRFVINYYINCELWWMRIFKK